MVLIKRKTRIIEKYRQEDIFFEKSGFRLYEYGQFYIYKCKYDWYYTTRNYDYSNKLCIRKLINNDEYFKYIEFTNNMNLLIDYEFRGYIRYIIIKNIYNKFIKNK